MLKTNQARRHDAPCAKSTDSSIKQSNRKRRSRRRGQTNRGMQEELKAVHMRLDYARAQYAAAIDAMEYWEREIFMIYNRMNRQNVQVEL
ncbi:hypothetical protein IL306_002359 [Fusarium sp. DS 682]|nr:hypothetical protein IL306_002359 [Fusarium sp. DS 682]